MGVLFAILMVGMVTSAQSSPADTGPRQTEATAKESAPADLLIRIDGRDAGWPAGFTTDFSAIYTPMITPRSKPC